MLSFIHYISALRRFKESEKTVYMMGGDREAPPMILAQRDIIKLEVDYYQQESIGLGLILAIVTVLGTATYFFLKQTGNL